VKIFTSSVRAPDGRGTSGTPLYRFPGGLVPARASTERLGCGDAFNLPRRIATLPGDDRHNVERKYLRFAGVGVQYALTILILTFAGIWLDEWLGTDPLFLVVCLLIAFVGATWSLVNTVLGPSSSRKKREGRQ
jgi:hypothetical protein